MSAVITTTPLTGRVAVVTGASSGIGAATARGPARLGAKVAVLPGARTTSTLSSSKSPAAGGTALAAPLDVTDRDAVSTWTRLPGLLGGGWAGTS